MKRKRITCDMCGHTAVRIRKYHKGKYKYALCGKVACDNSASKAADYLSLSALKRDRILVNKKNYTNKGFYAFCDASITPEMGCVTISACLYDNGRMRDSISKTRFFRKNEKMIIQVAELRALELAVHLLGNNIGTIVTDTDFNGSAKNTDGCQLVLQKVVDAGHTILLKSEDPDILSIGHIAAHRLCQATAISNFGRVRML